MKVVQEKTWYLVKESGGTSQLPVRHLIPDGCTWNCQNPAVLDFWKIFKQSTG
jgi:hypothetical protein